MSGFVKEAVTVLDGAIEAARRALRDLDPADVPESLRRVVASSSGRLPPPLARSLLLELDRSEWLRAEALERFEGGGPSLGFLERDEGWWIAIADAIAAERAARVDRTASEAGAQVDLLASEVRTLKGKLKEARRDADAAAADAKADLAAGRKRLEMALAEARHDLVAAREQLEDQETAIEAVVAERDEADAASRELAGRLRALRRELATAHAGVPQPAVVSVPREGVALARHLDLLAAMVPVRETGGAGAEDLAAADSAGSGAGSRQVLSVPVGIRPDAGEAFAWLLDQPLDFALVVDGHNVLFQLDPTSAPTGEARKRLVTELGRFRTLAAATPTIVVVFDSHVPGVREPGYRAGVELLYAEAGVAADDLVVEMAGDFAIPVVVVSSDRAVREGAEAVSAVALWSEALGAWLRGT